MTLSDIERDFSADEILETGDPACFDVITRGPGPEGELPLTAEMLIHRASGDAFGMTEDAGMGWDPAALAGPQFVMLSTMGGIRGAGGRPIALGHHTGNFELGLALEAAAAVFQQAGARPLCGLVAPTRATAAPRARPACSTAGLPQRRGQRLPPAGPLDPGPGRARRGHLRQGPARLDDGPGELPQAALRARPRRRDAAAFEGKTPARFNRSAARFARGELSLGDARRRACQVCSVARRRLPFFGTAASRWVAGEALGWQLPHSALALSSRSGSTSPGEAPRP